MIVTPIITTQPIISNLSGFFLSIQDLQTIDDATKNLHRLRIPCQNLPRKQKPRQISDHLHKKVIDLESKINEIEKTLSI